MKTKLIITIVTSYGLLLSLSGFTQNIGINTNTPHATAALEIKASDKGMLIPRTSTISRTAIVNPAKGLILYDTTSSSFWFYNGAQWQELISGNSGWRINGNGGTDTAINFIGTTDNKPLLIKVNNIQSGLLSGDTTFNTGFGFRSLQNAVSGQFNTALGSTTLISNSGYYNTATGSSALRNNTSGSFNTATGTSSLFVNTTGQANSAFGFQSMYLNNSGESNSAFGVNALFSNT